MAARKHDREPVRDLVVGLLAVILLITGYNTAMAVGTYLKVNGGEILKFGGEVDISGVDVSKSTSTAMSLLLVFPELKTASSESEVAEILIPSGTPEYANKIPVSYDDPVRSLNYLYKIYPQIKEELKKDPELWNRYLNLATKPVGISCEFCCGVGPVGITETGELRCGCQHNPALQALTMALMKYTDYSDAEVLREVLRWKALFFPKPMVTLAAQVAGKNPSDIAALPGMVGGC